MITGMPSGRCLPFALGIYTRRTGRGCQDPAAWCARTATAILAGRKSDYPVDPGRYAASIALGHLPHADQRVRP